MPPAQLAHGSGPAASAMLSLRMSRCRLPSGSSDNRRMNPSSKDHHFSAGNHKSFQKCASELLASSCWPHANTADTVRKVLRTSVDMQPPPSPLGVVLTTAQSFTLNSPNVIHASADPTTVCNLTHDLVLKLIALKAKGKQIYVQLLLSLQGLYQGISMYIPCINQV